MSDLLNAELMDKVAAAVQPYIVARNWRNRYMARPGPRIVASLHHSKNPIADHGPYQRVLARMCSGRAAVEGLTAEATLVLEDDNRFDPLAVRVEIGGQTVGYLDREAAHALRNDLGEDDAPHTRTLRCRAYISGGWDRARHVHQRFEVRLDVAFSNTPTVRSRYIDAERTRGGFDRTRVS